MVAPIIGLTGGIGAGKSTVAGILTQLGARVIDADRIGHEAYRPGSEGFARVVEAFGPGVVGADRAIDRRALGALVFADPAARARLNALVHPLIAAEVGRRIAAARAEGFDPARSRLAAARRSGMGGLHPARARRRAHPGGA